MRIRITSLDYIAQGDELKNPAGCDIIIIHDAVPQRAGPVGGIMTKVGSVSFTGFVGIAKDARPYFIGYREMRRA